MLSLEKLVTPLPAAYPHRPASGKTREERSDSLIEAMLADMVECFSF